MPQQTRLRDVFTPGGLPSVTYVSRDHLELEKKLSDAAVRGFAFIVVTGPTKSGKSVLCRRVLERDPLIVVEGGQIRSEADFWNHIAYQLDIASQTTRSSGETAGTSVTGEAGGGVAGFFQAKTGLAQADSTQRTSTLMRSIRSLIDDYNDYVDLQKGPKERRISPKVVGVVFTMVQEYGGGPMSAQRSYIAKVRNDSGLNVFKSYIKRNDTLFADAPQYGVPVVLSHHNNPSHQSVVEGLEAVATEFTSTLGL